MVRFHLKNAYAKVGVNDKTALAARVSALIPPVIKDWRDPTQTGSSNGPVSGEHLSHRAGGLPGIAWKQQRPDQRISKISEVLQDLSAAKAQG